MAGDGPIDLCSEGEDEEEWFREQSLYIEGLEVVETAVTKPEGTIAPKMDAGSAAPAASVETSSGTEPVKDAKSVAPLADTVSEITTCPATSSEVSEPGPVHKDVELTPEQKGVLRHVMEGRNCYYTGKAGTGKSHLLREIIKRAPAGKTFICASTGIAAVNIGGTTLHSFAGIGLGDGTVDMLRQKALGSKTSRLNWDAVQVLIVDEVSMLHGSLLTKLEEIARAAKLSTRPFGGVQLIFTGDFFQLPPVVKGGGRASSGGRQDYAFQSEVWHTLFPEGSCFELSTVFRQAEHRLVELLSEVRYARLSQPSIKLLTDLRRELSPPEGIEPTLLFGTNDRVDAVNNRRLKDLPMPEYSFRADDDGQEPFISQMRKNCIADEVLRLRVGAQVMLIRNLDQGSGLVNGTKGRVVGFSEEEEHWPIVLFANGVSRLIEREEWRIEQVNAGRLEKKASRNQVPLKLGWAITIHKSQGMGIEWLEVKLDDLFEDGQGYVALSRAIKLEGLRVVAFRTDRFRVSSQVVSFYDTHIKGRRREEHTPEPRWPVAHNWGPSHPKHVNQPVVDASYGGGGGGGRGRGRPYEEWNTASMVKRRRGMAVPSAPTVNPGEWLPSRPPPRPHTAPTPPTPAQPPSGPPRPYVPNSSRPPPSTTSRGSGSGGAAATAPPTVPPASAAGPMRRYEPPRPPPYKPGAPLVSSRPAAPTHYQQSQQQQQQFQQAQGWEKYSGKGRVPDYRGVQQQQPKITSFIVSKDQHSSAPPSNAFKSASNSGANATGRDRGYNRR